MLPESISVLMLVVVDDFNRLQIPYLVGGSMASALKVADLLQRAMKESE